MRNIWLILAGASGAVAVGMGAYGAHGLRDTLLSSGFSDVVITARMAERYEPAVLYHLVHSLALGLVGVLASLRPGRWPRVAGAAFLAGILLFSGLLYVLTFRDVAGLGAIVPIGGLAYIAGWIAVGVCGFVRQSTAA